MEWFNDPNIDKNYIFKVFQIKNVNAVSWNFSLSEECHLGRLISNRVA